MEPEIYVNVKSSVKKMLNINLDCYKDEQMRRRLDSWLVRSGSPDWNEYLRRLRNDQTELSRFRDYLTINVSTFFRDPERWQALRATILPALLGSAGRASGGSAGLKVWSAGCSIGAEPYSLAMVLDELGRGRSCRILATDLDRGALLKSKAGGPYTREEVQNLDAAQRAAYLEPGGPPFFVRPSLARPIEFCEHDLISGPYPSGMDLVVCRNVVIYFTAEAKDEIYRKFAQALRPGGVLFVGATEMVQRPFEIGLRSCGISFYEKLPEPVPYPRPA